MGEWASYRPEKVLNFATTYLPRAHVVLSVHSLILDFNRNCTLNSNFLAPFEPVQTPPASADGEEPHGADAEAGCEPGIVEPGHVRVGTELATDQALLVARYRLLVARLSGLLCFISPSRSRWRSFWLCALIL